MNKDAQFEMPSERTAEIEWNLEKNSQPVEVEMATSVRRRGFYEANQDQSSLKVERYIRYVARVAPTAFDVIPMEELVREATTWED